MFDRLEDVWDQERAHIAQEEEEAVTPIVELDTEQEEAEETDISSFVIFEHQDENTLI